MNRKIPCNRELKYHRCGKEFELLGNLKQHLNKKNKCQDIREVLQLQIQLKREEVKLEEVKLKIEETKLGHVKNEKISNQINGDHNNIHIGDTYNIINCNNGINYTINEANDTIVSGDVNSSLCNFIKLHFNNDEFLTNKCILLKNNKAYFNLNGKMVDFDITRPYFNKNIKTQIDHILSIFRKYDDEIMDANGYQQKEKFLSDDKIDTLEKIDPYIKNDRNIGKVKKNHHYCNGLILKLN